MSNVQDIHILTFIPSFHLYRCAISCNVSSCRLILDVAISLILGLDH